MRAAGRETATEQSKETNKTSRPGGSMYAHVAHVDTWMRRDHNWPGDVGTHGWYEIMNEDYSDVG